MNAESIAAALDRAAALIDVRGFARRTFEDINGCLCALGALRVAVFDRVDPTLRSGMDKWGLYQDAQGHLNAVILLQTGKTVIEWNDASTKDVVTAGLRRAARVARGEGQ